MAKRSAKPAVDEGRCCELVSPDGHVVVGFHLAQRVLEGERTLRKVPSWHVSVDGLPLLLSSRLVVALAGEPLLEADFVIQRITRHRVVDGQAALSVTLREGDGLRRLIRWTFRCTGEQVSISFTLPRQPGLPRLFAVQGDGSHWMLPLGAEALGDGLTGTARVRYPHGRVALVSGWGRFEPGKDRLRLTAGGAHAARAPFISPLRTLHLGRRPGDLVAVCDTATIPPPGEGGAVVRDATFSTVGGLACVRLAATVRARYVLYDYGWCGDPDDSATTGAGDTPDARLTRRFAGWAGLDVAAIARAGAARGIGVLLTLPWETVARHGPDLYATYRRWGVAGIVVGRFAAHDAATAARLVDAALVAGSQGLLFIVADAAWYALPDDAATRLCVIEGEPAVSVSDTCEQLFSRGGLGVVRACPGVATAHGATTHAHRLALPFVVGGYFPVLFDGCAPARSDAETPAYALWRLLPCDGRWDEVRWLRGETGSYAIVARRTGERWFVAGLNGNAARVQTVRLEDALPADQNWRLTLYRDAHAADAVTRGTTVIESFDGIRSDDRVRLEMAAGGGYVLALTPVVQGHV